MVSLCHGKLSRIEKLGADARLGPVLPLGDVEEV
jgi:hypothetical protein